MKTIWLAVLSTTCLLAQAPPNLQFEVASVRAIPEGPIDAVNIGLHLDGSQVHVNSLDFRDYVAMAYRVKQYQVSGPDWISSARFDVNAKLPDGAKSDQIPEMLQALLAERFQLKAHREQKELPVYALIVGKTPLKIQASAPGAESAPAAKGDRAVNVSGSAAGVTADLGNGGYYSFTPDGKFEIHKVDMAMLARQLERYLDRPIVDMTGLTGNYDLSVKVTQEDAQTMMIRAAVNAGMVLPPQAIQAMEAGSVSSLLDALQQLGLKLDARRAPLETIVIDQASKTPTAN